VRSRVEQFTALVAREPENEMFRFSLAQALVAEGRDEEAVPHYKVCIETKPDWMMARILFGKLLLKLGRRGEGTPMLQDALKLAVEQHHEDPERELRAILAEL
jgi:predicted Zn-dependent protease